MNASGVLLAVLMLLSMLLGPFGGAAWAQGEHGRRAGAEILVILGDARLLAGGVGLSDGRRKGLADRIRGGLAGLGLLMRLADAENGRYLSRRRRPDVNSLRALFATADMPRFIAAMEQLAQAYPFRVSPFRILWRKSRALARARTLHAQLCAGCHDVTSGEGERPAANLFQMARTLSKKEFLARMVVGVRGDRTTGLGNPLTDGEIAAFYAFYRAGPATTDQ